MTIGDYAYALVLGAGLTSLLALPVIWALIVAVYPGARPSRKLWFVAVSASLAYGSACLVEVLFYPADLVAVYLAPEWQDRGYTIAPSIIAFLVENHFWLSLAVGLVVGSVGPIMLRRKIWSRIIRDAA